MICLSDMSDGPTDFGEIVHGGLKCSHHSHVTPSAKGQCHWCSNKCFPVRNFSGFWNKLGTNNFGFHLRRLPSNKLSRVMAPIICMPPPVEENQKWEHLCLRKPRYLIHADTILGNICINSYATLEATFIYRNDIVFLQGLVSLFTASLYSLPLRHEDISFFRNLIVFTLRDQYLHQRMTCEALSKENLLIPDASLFLISTYKLGYILTSQIIISW